MEEGTDVTVITKIADVVADPTKADTGLFFFQGEEGAAKFARFAAWV